MTSVTLIYKDGKYRYKTTSDIQMSILGIFLSSDVGGDSSLFKHWALKEEGDFISGNITDLEKEEGFIYLTDHYSQEKVPTRLQMTIQQFIQLLDDWDEKVCKKYPQHVLIKQENGQFITETSD